jgi:hypothetical protein
VVKQFGFVVVVAALLWAFPTFAQNAPLQGCEQSSRVAGVGKCWFRSPQRGEPAPVTPSTASPPLSFCISETTICVVPDVGLQTVSYDLKAKKWQGGVTAMAAGWALLFASNAPYASGVAVHASFNFGQAAPSFFAPTFSFVICRWFEAGYTPVFMDGQIGQQLTFGVNVNAEALTALLTGQNLEARRVALAISKQQAEVVEKW